MHSTSPSDNDRSVHRTTLFVCVCVCQREREREREREKAGPGGATQPWEGEEGKRPMKVMVAIDESEVSFYALKWALDKVVFRRKYYQYHAGGGPSPSSSSSPTVGDDDQQELEMVTVTVVHVLQPYQPLIMPAGPVVYATPSVIESVRKAREQTADVILSRALQMCEEKKIMAKSLILEGDPKEMICEAAEKMEVDLLVVGSRGLSKFKRAFLGSVSDYCTHHAHCPILIVKPPKESHK